MNILIYLLIGGLIGFLTALLIQMKELPDVLFNISLGVIGAFIAGWIFTPLFGIQTFEPSYFSVPIFLISLAGSALLLTTINFVRWLAGQRTP